MGGFNVEQKRKISIVVSRRESLVEFFVWSVGLREGIVRSSYTRLWEFEKAEVNVGRSHYTSSRGMGDGGEGGN